MSGCATSILKVQMRALGAALATAERMKLPLYTDDRTVRLEARSLGLATFGTPSLLRVLVERGVMDAGVEREARRRLLVSGAHGVALAWEELASEVRDAGFDLTEVSAASLRDPEPWRHNAKTALEGSVHLLRNVSETHPTQLDVWILRVLASIVAARPDLSPAQVVALLLQSAGTDPEVPLSFLRNLERVGRLYLIRGA